MPAWFRGNNNEFMETINKGDFKALQIYLRDACGILLRDSAGELALRRLRPVLDGHELETVGELLARLDQPGRSGLKEAVVDAITTSESGWLAAEVAFEWLADTVFPELAERNPGRRMTIWSAACATGQEPYSIAMAACEFRDRNPVFGEVRIVATDTSRTALEVARRAHYEISPGTPGMSAERRERFFMSLANGGWRVAPGIRSMVEFRELNLLQRHLPGKFDVVVCQDALVYYSAEKKKAILTRFHSALNPGGYLVVGTSGLTDEMPDLFEPVKCRSGIAYRKK